MGYSCTAAVSKTLDRIQALNERIRGDTSGPINGLPNGGFYVLGRENRNGASTGESLRPYNGSKTQVVSAGSFRIAPNGRISCFPGLTARQIRAINDEVDQELDGF